jgi:hypothetical protein
MIQRVRQQIQRILSIKFVRDTITLQAGKMVLTAISVGAGILPPARVGQGISTACGRR